MSSRRSATVLAAALVVALTGCGVGAQHQASPLPVSQVPFGLLSPAPGNPPAQGAPAAEAVILYLLKGGHLVAVARELPAPAALNARLAALAAGPTANEAADGLASAVSAPGSAPTGTVSDDHVTVNLASGFAELHTAAQVYALAQLVYTATAIPGVDTVGFRIDNKPVAVPRRSPGPTTDHSRHSSHLEHAAPCQFVIGLQRDGHRLTTNAGNHLGVKPHETAIPAGLQAGRIRSPRALPPTRWS
jgi:hypothetical protein